MKILLQRSMYCIAALVLALGFLGGGAESAYACSCIARDDTEATVRADFERVGAVFRGTVQSVSPGTGEIRFAVSEVWKGPTVRDFTIKGAGESASCGWNPDVGAEYIVYAGFYDGEYQTGLCEPNHAPPLTSHEAAVFGSGTPLAERDGEPASFARRYVLPGMAALAIIVAAAFIAQRRRSA